MKTIKLPVDLVNSVSSAAGMTPEQYVSHSRSVVKGYNVPVTIAKEEGGFYFFAIKEKS